MLMPASTAVAEMALARRPADRWAYEWAVLLSGLAAAGRASGDERYLAHIATHVDHFVTEDGAIRTYEREELNLDRVRPGTLLLVLYARTREERYLRAVERIREQLRQQPRTPSGGFWHKAAYPEQMWLDG